MSIRNETVEWAPFALKDGATESDLLAAAYEIERSFLSKQTGYIRRELLKKDDNNWVDLIYWKSKQEAAEAMKAVSTSEACGQYFSLMAGMDDAEGGVSHFERVKAW